MAVITQTSSVFAARMQAPLSRTTLSAADTLIYQYGCGQVLTLFNQSASPVTVTFSGSSPTTLSVKGYGPLSTAGGKAVTVAAGGATIVPLDTIWAFLSGTPSINVTGGAGLFATLHSTKADPVVDLGPPAPTLDSIAAFRTTPTSLIWENVVWGPVTWVENVTGQGPQPFAQVMTITLPSGTAPLGGWPVITWTHPTGGTHTIGGGYMNNFVKQPALLAGYAFVTIEFRHPVSNADQGYPHYDIGRAIQFLRAYAPVLGLDMTQLYGTCGSRGNLVTWTTCQPSLINPTSSVYTERMDSDGYKAIWSMSGQSTYDPVQWATLFMSTAANSGTGGVGTAYDGYLTYVAANESPGGVLPPNGTMGSLLNSLDALGSNNPKVPHMVMQHERPYQNPQKQTVPAYPDLYTDKHYPNNGKVVREKYEALGYKDRILTIDNEDGEVAGGHEENWADSIQWFNNIRAGMGAREAWACARTSRRSQGGATGTNVDDSGIYYARPGSLDGIWSATDGSTGVSGTPTVEGNVGGITDGKYPLANRLLNTPSGKVLGQPTTANKPILKLLANGNYGFFYDTNDRFVSTYANASLTQSCYTWTTAQEWATAANTNATTVFVGQNTGNPTVGNMNQQTMVLAVIGKNAAAFSANDLKGFRQFADILTGTTTYSAFGF